MTRSPGLSEAAEPFATPPLTARAVVSPEGRIVIPAALRAAVGIRKGEKVILRVEDGVIVVETVLAQVRRVQAIVAQYIKPGGPSLVDEFIAERREMWGEE
jgi:AbrB family looped-hinge helix DNA binding protein